MLADNPPQTDATSTYGKSPIALTFHTPKASRTNCMSTYTALTNSILPRNVSESNFANTLLVLIRPWMGPLNSINTIMMLKICRLFPDMYIMIAFIGTCFDGARATSQAFLSFSVSVSTGLDGAAGADFSER